MVMVLSVCRLAGHSPLRVDGNYLKSSNIRRTQSRNLHVSHLALQLSSPQSTEARCEVENKDAFGVGAAPTTSEWSASLLPSKVRLILEAWRYVTFSTRFVCVQTNKPVNSLKPECLCTRIGQLYKNKGKFWWWQ